MNNKSDTKRINMFLLSNADNKFKKYGFANLYIKIKDVYVFSMHGAITKNRKKIGEKLENHHLKKYIFILLQTDDAINKKKWKIVNSYIKTKQLIFRSWKSRESWKFFFISD